MYVCMYVCMYVRGCATYGKPNVAIFNSFNFLCNFVLCIQLCVLYSTYIQHSKRYSIFNFPFNIQLFILNSILHLPIQLSIQQLFVQNSTIHSTFNYSFQFIKSFEPSLPLVSDAYYCLLKTWQRRRLEYRLRK